jgi:hypothetical protein
MRHVSRLDQELADALGTTQAVRAAVAAARARVDGGGKLQRSLEELDGELADLQEQVNAFVVEDRGKRGTLTRRSRLRRDAESALGDEADGLDALQLLAGEAAHALAQWKVVKPLAKASGGKAERALVKRALPLAEAHLELALRACGKLAKREAKALAAAGEG